METSHRLLLGLLGALTLSACGGGADSVLSKQPLSGTKQGFITIEERANKRVFDGWFSQGLVPVQAQSSLWESGAERCVRLLPDTFSSSNNYVGSRWRDTLSAGSAISVQSRGEEVIRLNAQTFDDAVVYASTERWLATPLPDDSQLMIDGSDQFPSFAPIPLSPLTPLIMNAPDGGVMTLYSQQIEWEPSSDDTDGIELYASSSDGSVSSSETVKCWLNDSGTFVLPSEVRSMFSPNRQLVVRLLRSRYSRVESSDATVLVTQTSYP